MKIIKLHNIITNSKTSRTVGWDKTFFTWEGGQREEMVFSNHLKHSGVGEDLIWSGRLFKSSEAASAKHPISFKLSVWHIGKQLTVRSRCSGWSFFLTFCVSAHIVLGVKTGFEHIWAPLRGAQIKNLQDADRITPLQKKKPPPPLRLLFRL